MNTTFHFYYKNIVITTLAFLLLTVVSGCGGGGSGGSTPANNGTGNTGAGATTVPNVTIKASVLGTGGIIVPTILTIRQGTTGTFTLSPGSNSSIGGVSGCGGVLTGTLFTTAAVNADCTIQASFVAKQAQATLSMSDSVILEGNSGTSLLLFNVVLSAAVNNTVSVDYRTSDGSANATSDYQAAAGTLNFKPGSTTGIIAVTINGDTAVELDETILLTLSNAVNATLTSTQAIGTIQNDDNQNTVNTPPSAVFITWQQTADNQVRLRGAGTDAEDGNLSGSALVWSSNIDGTIGTGGTLTTATLSSGAHTITLTVTDSNGASATASKTGSVNKPPVATLSTPLNPSTFMNNDIILFSGSATDVEDGVLTGASLVWKSSIDGVLGTGISFSKTLSVGTHVISLTATDTKNVKDLKLTTVTITSPAWRTEPSLPLGSPKASAVVIGSTIYALDDVSNIQLFDSLAGSWSSITGQGGELICAAKGKILQFGRFVLTNGRVNPNVFEAIGVDEYDPASGVWTRKADMPSKAAGATACHTQNSSIYLLGTAQATIGSNNGLHQYDVVSGLWTELQVLPQGRRYFASAVLNGKIYIIGGSGNLSTQWYMVTVYEYDIALARWSTKTALPSGRKRFAGTAYNGKLYVFGGIDSKGFSNIVQQYDPLTNKWLSKTVMPSARRNLASVLLNSTNRIYLIGGNLDPNGLIGLTTVESYDPLLDN